MKKIIFILGLCLISLVCVNQPLAEASESSGIDLVYELKGDTIELEWDDIGEKYVVYNHQEKIWEGNKSSYTFNEVKGDYSYSFTVIAYKDGEEYGISMANIHTPDNNAVSSFNVNDDVSAKEPAADLLFNTNLNAVVNNNEVLLELQGYIPDDNGVYEVYRDNDYIGVLDNNSFVDKQIERGKTYSYKVVGKREISDNDKKEVDQYIKENNLELNHFQLDSLYQKPFEMYRVVDIPKDIATKINQLTKVSYNPTYVFRYKTFIPDAKVPALSIVQGLAGYEFGGDGRGFSFSDTQRYRTWVETPISFVSGSKPSTIDTTQKNVNWTQLYDSKGNIKQSKKANNKGIKYKNIVKSKDKLSYSMEHGVAIPFGAAPEINYQYDLTINRDSSLLVKGDRDQAPSHEFYVYQANSDMIATLFQGTHKGFEYLLPPMPNATFRIQF